MGWKMDSHGNWTQTSGSGSKGGGGSSGGNSGGGGGTKTSGSNTVTDRGNTSDTNKAIADTTMDKTDQLKYAEEARFTMIGDYQLQRGGYLIIGGGVASRWKGEWLVLETTHTVNSRGYTTEGLCARKPYYEETKSKSDSSSSGGSSSSGCSSGGNSGGGGSSKPSGGSGNSGSSGGQWVMDPDGTWHKK